MIDPISAMASIAAELQSLASAASAPPPSLDAATGTGAAGATAAPSFSQLLHGALGEVDGAISSANAKAQAFASGDQGMQLSDVMVSLEQANLSLQLASSVRDKVVAAYANIMNMQI